MKVVIIGAGNVGFHIGVKLYEKDVEVTQVFSRKREKAIRLATEIGAEPCYHLTELTTKADLYIIAVKDDAIRSVVQELAKTDIKNKLVVHTSGGTDTEWMGEWLLNFGSFYPLQTFSLARTPDWSTIPICIAANSQEKLEVLKIIGKYLSPNIYEINDRQRAVLHVAAVFVNNFSNHLFQIGATICEKENLDFDILKPLIQETVNKLAAGTPAEMQTGPAVRKDEKTIATHLKYLEKHATFKHLYEALTASIQQQKLI